MSSSPKISKRSDAPEDWLNPTEYVDFDHPRILSVLEDKVLPERTQHARALAAFYHVRDDIKFGFARGFWDMPASRVEAIGLGYCNTKSTLFVALLRAAGIPARQVFVEIDASVLDGLINPRTAYVDHSYVEVWLEGDWIATDAYIVDPTLFQVAQSRLQREDRILGYGVHQTGENDWDGQTPSYSQFNQLDPRQISRKYWGAFDDVGAFYRAVPDANNRLNLILRTGFGVLAAQANRAADAMRQSSV